MMMNQPKTTKEKIEAMRYGISAIVDEYEMIELFRQIHDHLYDDETIVVRPVHRILGEIGMYAVRIVDKTNIKEWR